MHAKLGVEAPGVPAHGIFGDIKRLSDVYLTAPLGQQLEYVNLAAGEPILLTELLAALVDARELLGIHLCAQVGKESLHIGIARFQAECHDHAGHPQQGHAQLGRHGCSAGNESHKNKAQVIGPYVQAPPQAENQVRVVVAVMRHVCEHKPQQHNNEADGHAVAQTWQKRGFKETVGCDGARQKEEHETPQLGEIECAIEAKHPSESRERETDFDEVADQAPHQGEVV